MGALGYGAAFERRVMAEDQHEDGRQQREEGDDQEPGGEAACRVLQVAPPPIASNARVWPPMGQLFKRGPAGRQGSRTNWVIVSFERRKERGEVGLTAGEFRLIDQADAGDRYRI